MTSSRAVRKEAFEKRREKAEELNRRYFEQHFDVAAFESEFGYDQQGQSEAMEDDVDQLSQGMSQLSQS